MRLLSPNFGPSDQRPTLAPTTTATEPEALAQVPTDLVARLALQAPPTSAPSNAILVAAKLRIQQEQQQQNPRRHGWVLPSWIGWATAACLALVILGDKSGLLWRHFSGASASSSHEKQPQDENSTPPNSGESEASDLVLQTIPGAKLSPKDKGKFQAHSQRNTLIVPEQDLARLKQDLAKLRNAQQARFQPSPSLSRTVVVEMTDPDDPLAKQRLSTLKLSDRVAQSIADGVAAAKAAATTTDTTKKQEDTPTKKPEPKQPVVLSGTDGSWTGDVVIEKGLPNLGVLNLPEGTQIKHLDFPVDQAKDYRGLVPLTQGWFYDQFSDVLWKPTGQGHEYLGEKAPIGFDPENFAPPAESANKSKNTVPTTDSEVTLKPVDNADKTEISRANTELPPVRGYPIFDETTGSGSIILQNLPPPGLGESYQLWVTDPATNTPISIGLIPPMENDGDRVWFDLGGPGVAPSGYILTREQGSGALVPTGPVVLKGP